MNNFTKQMIEAALWTFIETFLATLGPSMAVMTVGDWGALQGVALSAAMSGGAAVASVIKSYIVRNIGNADSTLISAPSVAACEAGLGVGGEVG